MEGHEDILIVRTEKFLANMKLKHKLLSATFVNSVDKILGNLKDYEVGYATIEQVYDLIHWAESYDNFKEIEAEFKQLADTFWE